MATAVVATAYGGPEVLALIDIEVGPPGPGQVRLDVRAAGVNPFDQKVYSGSFGTGPDRLPMRLGSEAAGVVNALGEGATEGADGPLHPGDEVIAYPVSGAYASELLVPAANVVHKPGALSWEEAGGLLLAGVTAAHALAASGVEPGGMLLVHGASGGVGLMTVQLAVDAGARVIGTAGEANHELLRSLGAEPVRYGDGLEQRVRALAPNGVDAAIDSVGSDEAISVSLALVPAPSRAVTMVAFDKAAQLGMKAIGSGPGADPGRELRAAARPRLAQMAGEGRIKVVIAARFPLAQAADAHKLLGSSHRGGKIILLP